MIITIATTRKRNRLDFFGDFVMAGVGNAESSICREILPQH